MNDLTEAPTSITYSIVSPDGFPALLTIRDTEFKGSKPEELGLSGKMKKIEEWLMINKYKPQIKQAFGQKKELTYADHPCPTCGKRVVISENAKGKVEKCETQKYDFTTKITSGCTYFKWL